MPRSVMPLLLLVSLAACRAAPPATPRDEGAPAALRLPGTEEVPSPVATMTVHANAGAVVPGARTWLGARFKIAPGWHVYGENPGDAGMPTRVTVEAPPGFVIGRTVYPPPKKFVDAGDIVTHGYEREVMLLVVVDAPADLVPGTDVTFRVRGSWLACKDQCVKESGEATLVLKAGAFAPPSAESAALFQRFPPPTSPETPSP